VSLFKRGPGKLERLRAASRLQEATGRVQAIPAGARIFTSWSPKVRFAHLKSAVNPGSVCEPHSKREEPWLGLGSDEEREHAASLPLCPGCEKGDAQASHERRAS
jgi:hypothetical protein